MKKLSLHQQVTSAQLDNHHRRVVDIMNEGWFNKRKSKDNQQSKVISFGEVLQLTKKPKMYFIGLVQMMLDILRIQFNRKYVQNYDQPRSAKYTFYYDPSMQELILYVTLKIKGISNTFHYQTSTVFRLNDRNQITTQMGDEFLYMISLLADKTIVHDKDNVRDVLSNLSGQDAEIATHVYNKTSQEGPAQDSSVIDDMNSTDNTIRL